MRTRRFPRSFGLALALLVGVGVGVAVAAPTRTVPTVKTAHSSKYGTLLVSSTGFTLYQLGSETNRHQPISRSAGKASVASVTTTMPMIELAIRATAHNRPERT